MTNDWASDAVIASTTITFGFWDAVKHLFGWRLHVDLGIETENIIGRTSGQPPVICAVAPRWWPRHEMSGLVERSAPWPLPDQLGGCMTVQDLEARESAREERGS